MIVESTGLLRSAAGAIVLNAWLASIVFLAVWALTHAFRRLRPASQLALWSLVFLRLILPPGTAHGLSLSAIVRGLARHFGVTAGLERGGPMGAVVHWVDPQAINRGSSIVAALPPLWMLVSIAMWVLGAAAVSIHFARQRRRFRGVARTADPVGDGRVLAIVDDWRKRLEIGRRVRVVTSDVAEPPFTMGVLRPVVFVPRRILEDETLVESVIAHELVHVAHYDALWLRGQQLVVAVYFFNPLIWLYGARIDQERERCCDLRVLSLGRIGAREYARSLVDVLRLGLARSGVPAMHMPQRRFQMRVRNILESDGARPRLLATMGVILLCGFFFLPGAGSAGDDVAARLSRSAAQEDSAPSVDCELENPLPGGRVTWVWGIGRNPFTGKEVFHRGIDIAAERGTPVHAPAAGVVEVATEDYEESRASGTVIILLHDSGISTFYAHLDSLAVSAGQRVAQGEVVGYVGSTGKSTGSHLHFEVRRNGEHVNPAELIRDWRAGVR